MGKRWTFFSSIIIGLFFSCEERKMLRKIDGRWKVLTIEFESKSVKTVQRYTPSEAYLIFDQCRDSQNGNSSCKMQYRKDGQVHNFYYYTSRPSPDTELVISLDNKPGKDSAFLKAASEVLGGYKVEFNQSKMNLHCSDCDLSQIGHMDYKVKKIVAVRQ